MQDLKRNVLRFRSLNTCIKTSTPKACQSVPHLQGQVIQSIVEQLQLHRRHLSVCPRPVEHAPPRSVFSSVLGGACLWQACALLTRILTMSPHGPDVLYVKNRSPGYEGPSQLELQLCLLQHGYTPYIPFTKSKPHNTVSLLPDIPPASDRFGGEHTVEASSLPSGFRATRCCPITPLTLLTSATTRTYLPP